MNLNKIKEILNSQLEEEEKKQEILETIAEDENAISSILSMIHANNAKRIEYERDMKLELAKTQTYLQLLKETKQQANQELNKKFLLDGLNELFDKYKNKC